MTVYVKNQVTGAQAASDVRRLPQGGGTPQAARQRVEQLRAGESAARVGHARAQGELSALRAQLEEARAGHAEQLEAAAAATTEVQAAKGEMRALKSQLEQLRGQLAEAVKRASAADEKAVELVAARQEEAAALTPGICRGARGERPR